MSRETRNFVIVIVVLVLGGCACCICSVIATGGAIVGSLGALVGLVVEGPYQVNARPLPANDHVDTLLPRNVGGFTRESVSGAPDDGGATAVYRRGDASITMQAQVFATTVAAQAAVERIGAQYEGHSGHRSQGSVNFLSYLYYVGGGEGRMAWNRDRYFFAVQTNGQGDLDAFMNAFPY